MNVDKIEDVTNLRFRPEEERYDEFDVDDHLIKDFDVNECLEVCSSTKEIKDELKNHRVIKKTLNKEFSAEDYYIFHALRESENDHVVSYKQFISICSGIVMSKYRTQVFDESMEQYRRVSQKDKIAPMNPKYINRLAEKQGINRTSQLYWLFLPGFENLYHLYPGEVLAISYYRINDMGIGNMNDFKVVAGKAEYNDFDIENSDIKEQFLRSYKELKKDSTEDFYKQLVTMLKVSA